MTRAVSREVKNVIEGFPEEVTSELYGSTLLVPGVLGHLFWEFKTDS